MQDLLEKRTLLESDLRSLEKQIFDLETVYIEETFNTGNIIKGWEGFLSNKNTKSAALLAAGIKRVKCNPTDRIFSLSSTTSPATKNDDDDGDNGSVVGNGNQASNLSKRNKKKRTQSKYDNSFKGDGKKGKEDLYFDDEEDSSEYLKQVAKTPASSKDKHTKKKITKKTKTKKSEGH